MSTMTPSGVRRKVIPITLPVNVPNIRHRSVSARKTITILNAMPRHGVSKTVIIQLPALCRPLLIHNVRTASLITSNAKKTGRGLVGMPDTLTHVLRGDCMQRQTVVLMTNHSASAVLLRLLPDARPAMP